MNDRKEKDVDLKKVDSKSGLPAAKAAGLERSQDELDDAGEVRRRRERRLRKMPADMRCSSCGIVKSDRARWSARAGLCRSCAYVRGVGDTGIRERPDPAVSVGSMFYMVHRHRVQAQDVRAARLASGMRGGEAALKCGWSNSKQSGFERYGGRMKAEDYETLVSVLGPIDSQVQTAYRSRPHEVTRARVRRRISARDLAYLCGWEPHRQMRIEDSLADVSLEEARRLVEKLTLPAV